MPTTSPMSASYYAFYRNMWVMRKVTEAQLQLAVSKGNLTQEEYETIIVTPQA